jgi:hypothetical protein
MLGLIVYMNDQTKNKKTELLSLIKLLGAEQDLFLKAASKLEESSGKLGATEDLANRIELKFKRASNLILGPGLVDPEKIYDGLIDVMEDHNRLVEEKYLGLSVGSRIDEVIEACAQFCGRLKLPKKTFALKKEIATEMLMDHPPARAMKFLGYKDAKEMILKEGLEVVYGAIRFSEGEEWLDKFNQNYTKLRPQDFEERETVLIKMPLKWEALTADFIKKKRHNITHLKELGVVLALETSDPDLRQGLTLKALPLMAHYFFEVSLYGAFFKLESTGSADNFGQVLVDTILAKPHKIIHKHEGDGSFWPIVQRYFGKLADAKEHPEIFEPHIHPEDLHWRKAETVIFKQIPELSVWQDLDWVAKSFGQNIISLNFMDLSLSYANSEAFGGHYIYHFRESLWNQIFATSLGQAELNKDLLENLDNSVVEV